MDPDFIAFCFCRSSRACLVLRRTGDSPSSADVSDPATVDFGLHLTGTEQAVKRLIPHAAEAFEEKHAHVRHARPRF
jgi:hypothetical protein